MADFGSAKSIMIKRVKQSLSLVVRLKSEPKADPAGLQSLFVALFYSAEAQEDAYGEDCERRAQ